MKKEIQRKQQFSFQMHFSIQEQLGIHKDRKSTRLNSSHLVISYAVFCLKKKNKTNCSTARTSRTSSRRAGILTSAPMQPQAYPCTSATTRYPRRSTSASTRDLATKLYRR